MKFTTLIASGTTNDHVYIEEQVYERDQYGNVCPLCKNIKIEALPHNGSWSVPVCRCWDTSEE